MKTLLVILSILAVSVQAQYHKYRSTSNNQITTPSYHSTYDVSTGTRYSTTNNSDGSSTVRGSNLTTGSTWRTTIESDGDMKGTDADGNRWKYNNSTGRYYNYGTGETRKNGKCYFNCDE